MDILCLMGLFPKEYEKTIIEDSIGGIQNAANKFQWGIVKGLGTIDEIEYKIINSLYIGSYPKRYNKIKIPSFIFTDTYGVENKNVGFINVAFYKILSKYLGIKKEIDNWANNGNRNNKAIIAYAMTSPFVEILNYIKKKYPEITCCLVVPDLPEYMNVSAGEKIFYRIAKNLQIKHFKKKLKLIDCYVLLTKHMVEWFDWKIKYTVIEGISSKIEKNSIDFYNTKKEKKILYAGMIEEKYGVVELVESFIQIKNKDWILELYGNGTALKKIEEISKYDSRVHVMGIVPNSKVLQEQRKAEILINPRCDQYEFTKYSFPSKIIEYMESGTPMIGYKLSGMPEEYEGYFYEISSCKNGIKNSLEEVMKLSSNERMKKGKEALNFVIEEKNATKQCEKIIKLLKEIKKENFI